MKLGADCRLKNKKGLGVMHFAAGGEALYALTYFKNEAISINEKDSEGNGPLHHAAMKGRALALYFLIGWNADLDA